MNAKKTRHASKSPHRRSGVVDAAIVVVVEMDM